MTENGKCYNYKLYRCIRENGGWENYEVVKIEEVDDMTRKESIIHERRLYDEFNGISMNSNKPFRTAEEKKIYDKEYFKSYYSNPDKRKTIQNRVKTNLLFSNEAKRLRSISF
jgi:hypothetical protein